MRERFSFYGIRPLPILFMAATVYDGGMGLARENARRLSAPCRDHVPVMLPGLAGGG